MVRSLAINLAYQFITDSLIRSTLAAETTDAAWGGMSPDHAERDVSRHGLHMMLMLVRPATGSLSVTDQVSIVIGHLAAVLSARVDALDAAVVPRPRPPTTQVYACAAISSMLVQLAVILTLAAVQSGAQTIALDVEDTEAGVALVVVADRPGVASRSFGDVSMALAAALCAVGGTLTITQQPGSVLWETTICVSESRHQQPELHEIDGLTDDQRKDPGTVA